MKKEEEELIGRNVPTNVIVEVIGHVTTRKLYQVTYAAWDLNGISPGLVLVAKRIGQCMIIVGTPE